MPQAGPGPSEKKRSRAPASKKTCDLCSKEVGAQGLANHRGSAACLSAKRDLDLRQAREAARHAILPQPRQTLQGLATGSGSSAGSGLLNTVNDAPQPEGPPKPKRAVKHNPFGMSLFLPTRGVTNFETTGRTNLSVPPGAPFPEGARLNRSDLAGLDISTEHAQDSPPASAPRLTGLDDIDEAVDPIVAASPSIPSMSPTVASAVEHTGAYGDLPVLDDIKVETHPSARVPPAFYPYEKYNANLPQPDPAAVKSSSSHPPWYPFGSKLDFDIAEFMQAQRFNSTQSKEFLSLIERVIRRPKDYHLTDLKEIDGLWDVAAILHDSSMEHKTYKVPYKGDEIEYDIWVRDLWSWCLELLQDPVYVRQMRWHALRLYRYNGFIFERFINEPWTADDWWEILSRLPDGAVPFCIILYADRTNLTTMGTQKGYPIYARCANLPIGIRNSDGPAGARLVGLLPIVSEDADKSGKKGFVDFKHIVWHKGFEVLLAKLKQYTATGCTVLCGDGIERLIVPVLLILSADYEEQCMMAAMRGTNSHHPCPSCLAPLEELYKISKDFEPRTARSVKAMFQSIIGKTRDLREKVLKAVGLRDVKNVFWGWVHSDVYQALAWDRLHAYHGGLFSDHLLEEFLEILDVVPRKHSDEFEKQLDAFPRWRDLNHFKEIAQFREFTDGRKYEDLSKVIIFAAHNTLMDFSEKYSEHTPRAYQLLRLMRRYLELDMFSSLRNHNDATLELGRKALLDWEQDLIKYRRIHPTKSWNFPKAHTHKHLVEEIRRKGATRNSNTKTFEALHPMMKKDFKRSNNREFIPQLARLNARDYSAFIIRQEIDRVAAARKAALQMLEEDEQEGEQISVSLPPSNSSASAMEPIHLTVGSRSRSSIQRLYHHFPLRFQSAFKDIHKKISARLSTELNCHIQIESHEEVTIYRYAKVDYGSYKDATIATDYLRMNSKFHGRERYDCGLFSVYGDRFMFGQMVVTMGVDVDGTEYLVSLILPFDEKTSGSSRVKVQRDRDLMFHRVRACPRMSDSAVVLARTLVRGALLVPDFAEKWPGDEYLVVDVVDADMWLRMKDISGRFATRVNL